MTTADNLARARGWLTWYAEQPMSEKEVARACDHCGFLNVDDVQRRLTHLLVAAVEAKGKELCSGVAIEAFSGGTVGGILDYLRAHAADVPEVPHGE